MEKLFGERRRKRKIANLLKCRSNHYGSVIFCAFQNACKVNSLEAMFEWIVWICSTLSEFTYPAILNLSTYHIHSNDWSSRFGSRIQSERERERKQLRLNILYCFEWSHENLFDSICLYISFDFSFSFIPFTCVHSFVRANFSPFFSPPFLPVSPKLHQVEEFSFVPTILLSINQHPSCLCVWWNQQKL